MKGHPRKVTEGVYDLIVYIGRDANGKPKYKSRRFRGGARAAEEALAAFVTEVKKAGGYVEPAKDSLGAYLDQWLTGIKGTVTPLTWRGYHCWINNHLKRVLGEVPLAKLTPAHLRTAYAELREGGRLDEKGGLSAQSVLHIHRTLKTALNQAMEDGLIPTNPSHKVKPPEPEDREMMVLDEEQTLMLLLKAQETSLYVPIVIAATTGMRCGEVLALRWQDVDLEGAMLTVAQAIECVGGTRRFKAPKTKRSRRTIKIQAATVAVLREWRAQQFEHRQAMGDQYEDQGLVICRLDGKPLHPAGFSARFGEFIQATCLPKIRFHDLRHTHASQLLDQGAQVTEVSSRLGHSRFSTTWNVYAHRMKRAEDPMIERFAERLGWQVAEGDG